MWPHQKRLKAHSLRALFKKIRKTLQEQSVSPFKSKPERAVLHNKSCFRYLNEQR